MSLSSLLDRLAVPLATSEREPENPTTPRANHAPAKQEPEVHRLWLIRHADGVLFSHSFCPPASLEEVRGWHPDAMSIEVEGGARP